MGRTVGRMLQITFPRCPSSYNFAFSADLKAYPDAHKSADRYNVARDRTLLHLKVLVTENWIACREGIRGTPDEARVLWIW